MNLQVVSILLDEFAAVGQEVVIPLQECSCVQVAESVEETAEAVLTAGRLKSEEEAGQIFSALFVP